MLRARGSSFLMLSIQPFFSLSRHTGHGHQAGHAPCVQFPWEEWLNGERFSAAAVLGGVRVAELELAAHQILLIVELGALQIDRAFHVHDDADAVDLVRLIVGPHLRIEVHSVTEARAAPTFHAKAQRGDRKSTRLNSSHLVISYAVFCLKKKK